MSVLNGICCIATSIMKSSAQLKVLSKHTWYSDQNFMCGIRLAYNYIIYTACMVCNDCIFNSGLMIYASLYRAP